MFNSKLLSYYKALTKKERRELGEYLQLSWINSDKKLIALNDYLQQHEKLLYKTETAVFDKTAVYTQLYGTPYQDERMRQIMLGLTRQIEAYWTFKELHQQYDRNASLLTDALRRRRLDKQLFGQVAAAQKKLNRQPLRDIRYHYHQLQWQDLLYFHPNKKEDRQYLESALHHLDRLWLLKRLRYSIELLNWRWQKGYTAAIPFYEAMLQRTQEMPFTEDSLVTAYRTAVLLLDNEERNQTDYEALKAQVQAVVGQVDADERGNLVALLINTAYYSMYEDKQALAREAFDCYQWAFEEQLLLENGYIDLIHFLNCIDIACGLRRFEWVEAFIKKYIGYLDTRHDVRQNVELLLHAQVAFAQQRYAEMTSMLENLEFRDTIYGRRRYTLLIRSYYKLHRNHQASIEPMYQYCTNYERYLRRKYREHALDSDAREAHLHFIKILRKLPWCEDSRYAPDTPDSLQQLLLELGNVAAMGWVYQEIQTLRKG